jgi:ribosomal protein S18 acetylase RimI-like enzyme
LLKIDNAHKYFKDVLSVRREVFCNEEGEKPSFVKDTRDENGVHVVCVIKDTVVGCGSLYNNGNGEFELSKIAVKKDYRRFEIGSEILKDLKS